MILDNNKKHCHKINYFKFHYFLQPSWKYANCVIKTTFLSLPTLVFGFCIPISNVPINKVSNTFLHKLPVLVNFLGFLILTLLWRSALLIFRDVQLIEKAVQMLSMIYFRKWLFILLRTGSSTS